MELSRLIKDKEIKDFDILKNILEVEPYNLKIKEDTNYPNLFLIHNNDNSDLTLKIVNECNGIILDKNTLKIVCYTFDKSDNSVDLSENLDKNNLFFEYSIEGTLMRLFYYENNWIFSTKKCIDASKARWLSEKNFIELFMECIINFDIFSKLDKNSCYSFIITHPENNIVVQNITPFLYHISTRNMNTLEEYEDSIGITKLEKSKIEKENLPNILTHILNDTSLLYEGYIFIDNKYNRWKIKTPIFNKVRSLWGNSNNRFFRYLELRKDTDLLQEYLKYFPNDRLKFAPYEIKINDFANILLTAYVNKHITKVNNTLPYYFVKIVYKLHGDYLKDRIVTDNNKVMLTLLNLDAKLLCFLINSHDKYISQSNKMETEENNDNTTNVV